MKKNKGLIFICIILAFIVIALFNKVTLINNSKNLNLVIISLDTLRPDHMSVYGYNKDTTPNIKEFAKKATIFTNVSTVVPMTNPSFTALMTGIDMYKTRIVSNNSLNVSVNTKTLATRLKEQGYYTSAFVTGENNLTQGFEDFKFHLFKFYYTDNGQDRYGQNNRQDYEDFVQQAINSIQNNKGRKFFTWIHLMDPHAPYFPPDEFKCKFDSKYCSKLEGKTLNDIDGIRAEYQKCQNGPIEKDTVQMMKDLYDGDIAAGDKLVGRIISAIKQNGLDKNTIIVIYGDHGEGFDHNFYFNHQSVLYNSATQIPLIIYYPLNPQRRQSSKLLQNTDVLPTLLDLIGIPYGNLLSGTSVASSFNPNLVNKYARKYSFSADSTLTKFSITDGIYKYILSLPGSCMYPGQPEELYNIKNDWNETKNIIKDEPSEAKLLKSELLKELSQYNLPQVSVDNYRDHNKRNESSDL